MQAEKYHVLVKTTTKLASLASEETGLLFEARHNVLNFIVSEWEKGKSVRVCSSK